MITIGVHLLFKTHYELSSSTNLFEGTNEDT